MAKLHGVGQPSRLGTLQAVGLRGDSRGGSDSCSAVSRRFVALPKQVGGICLLCFVFAPAVLFNSIFHAGATVVSGVYCPGLLTAIVSYLPLFYFLSRLAFREGLLSAGTGILALVIAGVFHVMEVGHTVYKAW